MQKRNIAAHRSHHFTFGEILPLEAKGSHFAATATRLVEERIRGAMVKSVPVSDVSGADDREVYYTLDEGAPRPGKSSSNKKQNSSSAMLLRTYNMTVIYFPRLMSFLVARAHSWGWVYPAAAVRMLDKIYVLALSGVFQFGGSTLARKACEGRTSFRRHRTNGAAGSGKNCCQRK